MGNLLTYGGLTTKIKAMKSRLIQDEQFREMAGLDSVTSAVDFLKGLPSYSHILKGAESGELHRGQIEQLLLQAMYYDFSKLYRFSNLSQRKFMDLYFMHFEITILKRCLRSIIGHQPLEVDLSQFADFFSRHSKVDLIRLSASRNLTEFTANLTGSPYYPMLVHLNNQEHMTLFDYEMNLDLIYFKTMWKVKDKHLKKSEREAISQCFGEKLDMLNIQWIYRSLKYYHMEPAQDVYKRQAFTIQTAGFPSSSEMREMWKMSLYQTALSAPVRLPPAGGDAGSQLISPLLTGKQKFPRAASENLPSPMYSAAEKAVSISQGSRKLPLKTLP